MGTFDQLFPIILWNDFMHSVKECFDACPVDVFEGCAWWMEDWPGDIEWMKGRGSAEFGRVEGGAEGEVVVDGALSCP